MSRPLQTILAVLLLLPALPGVAATHNAPHAGEDPDPPQVSGRPAGTLGPIPVDRAQDDAVDGANQGFNATRPVLGAGDDTEVVVNAAAPVGELTLLRDRFEGDRRGGFGDWTVVGDPAWGVRDANGTRAFTTGSLEKGYYPGNTQSLLVTPEIDLRTGILPTPQAPPEAQPVLDALAGVEQLDVDPDAFFDSSAVYRMVLHDLANLLYSPCYHAVSGSCLPPGNPVAGMFAPGTAEPREGAFYLEFQRRHNLATDGSEGRDGVQVFVFSKQPSLDDLSGCFLAEQEAAGAGPNYSSLTNQAGDSVSSRRPTPSHACTRVRLMPAGVTVDSSSGFAIGTTYGRPTNAFGGEPAWTGSSPWQKNFVDLSSWAGESVWVGFLFKSGPTGDARYFRSNVFDNDPDAAFRGFQLDNVSVRAPAPQQSLVVRPLLEPSYVPDDRTNVTLPLGSTIPVAVDIANLGTNPFTADVRVELADSHDPSRVLFTRVIDRVTVAPALANRTHYPLGGFSAARSEYLLTVSASIVASGTVPKAPEPETADNELAVPVDIEDVTALRHTSIARSLPTVPSGDPVTFSVRVVNGGNVPVHANATAEIVSAETGLAVDTLPFLSDRTVRSGPIAAGASANLEWTVQASVPGQYHVFVRINDENEYDPVRDGPGGRAPLLSTWAKAPPAIDGAVERGDGALLDDAWLGEPLPIELRDIYNVNPGTAVQRLFLTDSGQTTGTLRVMNDEEWLYVALSVPCGTAGFPCGSENRALALFVDRGADGQLATGADDGYLVRGAPALAVNLTYSDPDRVRPGDIRLSGGTTAPFRPVQAADPDVGAPLSDGERLWRYGRLQICPEATPPCTLTYLDLDASSTVSVGDFALHNGTFVDPSEGALGRPLPVDEAAFLFKDRAGGSPGLHDPGEPVFLGTCGGGGCNPDSNVTDGSLTDAGNDVGGGTQLFFPAKPALRYRDADGDRQFSKGDTLYVEPWRLAWRPTAGLGWAADAALSDPFGNPAQRRTGFEAKAPLGSAEAGDLLRLAGLLANPPTSTVNSLHQRFPAAPIVDGEGFTPRDGSLADETASWLAVELAGPPSGAGSSDTLAKRLPLVGFGVDQAPPPLLEASPQDCSSLAGWAQTGILPAFTGPAFPGKGARYEAQMGRTAEKWNCAPYGPDGKPRLYEGLSPDSMCSGRPCPQWGAVPGAAPLAQDGATSGQARAVNPNDLVSPPFRIGDVADPYLLLRHQYSSEVWVNDAAATIYFNADSTQGDAVRSGHIGIGSFMRVFVQPWNETRQAWDAAVLLAPSDGYSTEASTGLLRPSARRVPNAFGPSWVNLGQNPPQYTEPGPCVYQQNGNNLEQNLGFREPCGWWAPTGWQPWVQPEGEPITTGQGFRGSPWTLDRLPLFGSGHGFDGSQSLSLTNRTVRLVFEYYPTLANTPSPDPLFPRDVGWRIEGIAVTEGPSFTRDAAVTGLDLIAPLYDPAEIGLGPGTTLMVNVTVANEGLIPLPAATVCLDAVAFGQPAPKSPCTAGSSLAVENLTVGEVRTVALPFTVPAAEGTHLSFRASIEAADDFASNDILSSPDLYEVRSVPDVEVVVDATPKQGPATLPRTLLVQLVNRGNVPATMFNVSRVVVRNDGASGGTPVLNAKTWLVNGTLGVGQAVDLQSLNTTTPIGSKDLQLPAPGRSGSYSFVGQVRLDGDVDPGNDVDVTGIEALDVLYQNKFDTKSSLEGLGIPAGQEALWTVRTGGADGKLRLVAGDPETGDLPLGANLTLELPALDLRSARDAVLTFLHRYDLEPGFDGARVEISVGGGPWRPLRPVPHLGMPDGYPSINMTGTNPLLGGAGEAPAIAFTGRSEDVPGARDGWILSEFDLASDPALSRRSALDQFRLDGLAPSAGAFPTTGPAGEAQFLHDTWILDEDDAEETQRYWWIQNLTYDAPQPRSGELMWWSGTSGAPPVNVRNRLERTVAVPAVAPEPNVQLLATWWEWRAGGDDGGTGALFSPEVAGLPRPAFELAREPSGWRQMAIDVSDRAGQTVTLRFGYDSVPLPEFRDPSTENNLGWFVDDVQLVASRVDPTRGLRLPPAPLGPVDDLEGLNPVQAKATGATGPWRTQTVDAGGEPADIPWSLVGPRVAQRDGGWHVEPTPVPGRGEIPAWRFAADNEQGYPFMAESRLVTPVIDLAQASGDLRLTFDHSYWFESIEVCPTGVQPPDLPEQRRSIGCFRSALDGGAVEYQVLDPATGEFGAWQPLGARFDEFPERLLFDAQSPLSCGTDCSGSKVDRLSGLAGSRSALDATGYPAIEQRGERAERRWNALAAQGCDDVASSFSGVGHGSQWPALPALAQFGLCPTTLILEPWRPYPVSYVFSGGSNGIGGWATESWDVSPLAGRQVRFAFHAFSNPSYTPQSGDREDRGARGWSVANVGVVGNTFEGRDDVRLRLRLATDGSLAAGEWSVDELALSGTSFGRNVAVRPDGPDAIEAATSADVAFTGNLTNLGAPAKPGLPGSGSAIPGLALAVWALDETTLAPLPAGSWAIEVPADPLPLALPDGLPDGARGFRLPRPLGGGESFPLRVALELPGDETTVGLHFLVLENHPTTVLDEGGPGSADDRFVQVDRYEPFAGEVPGNTESSWLVSVTEREQVDILSPLPGRAGPLVVDPASARPGQDVTVSAALRNGGTTEPDVTARWDIHRVLHKGDTAHQARVGRPETELVVTRTEPIGLLEVGERAEVSTGFNATEPGLYRATLSVREGDRTVNRAAVEFLVLAAGAKPGYYAIDFAAVDAATAGWRDASPDPGADGDGTPPGRDFRDIGDRLLWGVTPEQYGQQVTYCSPPAQCNFAAEQGGGSTQQPPPIRDWTGLNGTALGAPIDLTLVPQGHAYITLRHDVALEPGDGARLEAIPMEAGSTTTSAYTCMNGDPMPFVLLPEPHDLYQPVAQSVPGDQAERIPNPPIPGETRHNRNHPFNPLGDPPAQAFTGTLRDHVTRFDLDQEAVSACRGTDGKFRTVRLVNYTIQPVLHVGTLPGYTSTRSELGRDVRLGAQGWSVSSLAATSAAIDLRPSQQTYVVQGGAPKDFLLTVTNRGELQDTVAFALDPGSTLPSASWITLPAPVVLAPGETRILPLHIAAPTGPELRPGLYSVPILARSQADANVLSVLDATVEVRSLALPDLDVELTSDVGPEPVMRTGTIEPLHMTVFNVGQTTSRATEAVLTVVGPALPDPVELDRQPVPALCPRGRPGCALPSQATINFEWSVPDLVGDYTLEMRVDPDARLIETAKANNRDALAVLVAFPQEADLAVTDLAIAGAGSNGVAQEGRLLTFTATVTNTGTAAAGAFRLSLTLGSSTELITQSFPGLEPGQSAQVTQTKVVSRGDYSVQARAFLTSGIDADPRNNELRRSLRVQGHDLSIAPVPALPRLAPGQSVDLVLNVSNRGNAVDRVLLQLEDAGWGLQAQPNPVTLAPGDNATIGVRLRAPDLAPAGKTTLRLAAIPSSQPGTRSLHALTVEVEPLPGAPAAGIANVSAPPGAVRLPVTLASRGNVEQDLAVELESPAWNATAQPVRLPAGASRTVELALAVPGSTPPGPHDLVVLVRGADGSPLLRQRGTLAVEPGPDVDGAWSGAVQATAQGLGVRAFQADLRLTNSGNVPVVPQVTLRDLGPGLAALPVEAGGELAPGESRLVRATVRLAADAPEHLLGRADLWAVPGNGTGPAVLAATLDLPAAGAAPDLQVTRADPSPRTGLAAGQTVRVTVTVANRGATEAPPSVLYAAANGVLVQPVGVPAIPAGGSVPVNVTLRLERAGDFVLSFLADGDGTVPELRDDDNGLAVDLEVGKPGVDDRLRSVPAAGAAPLAALAAAAALLRRRRSA